MKKSIIRAEMALLLALILCATLNITSFSQQCNTIRTKMLRMHVIANSDSEIDQRLKLTVRDAVLEKGKEIFNGSVTAESAKEKIIPFIPELENEALSVIKKEGFDYPVKITVEKEYFATRTYENSVTLPAGDYMAVKVIIGEGKGHNWWCVMFPPMCLPASEAECDISDVLSDEETEIVTNGNKYKFRLKIVEIVENYIKSK